MTLFTVIFPRNFRNPAGLARVCGLLEGVGSDALLSAFSESVSYLEFFRIYLTILDANICIFFSSRGDGQILSLHLANTKYKDGWTCK